MNLEVLKSPIPVDTKIVGFADNVVIVVVEKYLEEVTQMTKQAIVTIKLWLSKMGL